MRVALFVPCYVDQLRPEVGLAALTLLEEAGIEAAFPTDQACCGQPLLTAGAPNEARRLAERYARVFEGYDHVVMPSGSCAATVREQYGGLLGDTVEALAARTHELCEFLVEIVGVDALGGRLKRRVGLHASCHALRGLRLGTPSESREPTRRDPARTLLESVQGIELVDLTRTDECCGFGGVFALDEAAVSVRMGADRLADHRRAGAEVVTSTDVSCLLHLGGVASRRGLALPTVHVAELLAERERA